MTKQSKTQKTRSRKPDLTRQTVAGLLKTKGVPLWVQFWLESYAAGEEGYAISTAGLHDDPATQEIARLVYDVLETDSHVQFAKIDDDATYPRFPAEARDFIEEWMYHITAGDGMLNPWGNSEMAVMALTIALDTSAGPLIEFERDPTLAMLRGAMKALTTKRERREFLRNTTDTDAEPVKESDENWRASFQLSRVLADPRTPAETRDEIERALCEFANAAEVQVTHPALARRAFQLMCDARPKGKVRECRRLRGALLGLLDSAPDVEGGGDAE